MPLLWSDPAGDARRAEADGMDGVWSTEAGHDPYLPLALAAAATERVALGPAIAVAFPRSPMVHAQVAWDLHRMAPGRFILGLGPQVKAHNMRRYSAPYDHPAPRLRDMVRAIRAIWQCWQEGGKLDYHGEFYTHTLMTPFFNPGPVDGPLPRIFIAAVGEPMLRVAGAECDGIHVHPLHTVRSLDQVTLPVLREAATAAGRDPAAIELAVPAMIATGRTAAEVEQAVPMMRAQIAFYASTPTYRSVLDAHGRGDTYEALHDLSLRGGWAEMPGLVDDELLHAVCTVATWDDLPAELARRYSGRVHRVMPYSLGDAGTPWREIAAGVRAESRRLTAAAPAAQQ